MFIEVKRIITSKDSGKKIVGDDNIRIASILSFRQWHKKADEEHEVPGELTLLKVKTWGTVNGKWAEKIEDVTIQESVKSFQDRIGEKAGLVRL
jgi:hypothetical protein